MIKKEILKGALFYLFLCILCNSVWAFAGNVYVEKALLDQAGVTVTGVYAGNRVNQAGAGATNILALNQNYNVEGPFSIGAGDQAKNYMRYTIYNSPSNPAHILFDNGKGYSINSSALGTNVPTDAYIGIANVIWYKKGQPSAPLIAGNDIKAGYEVAQAKWEYPKADNDGPFEYSAMKIQVLDADADNAIVPARDARGGAVNQTVLSGYPPAKLYSFGELLDGRVLKTDVDGHNYLFNIIGVVDGQPESPAENVAFTTKVLAGAGGGAIPFTLSLAGATADKPGINSFGMPFQPADVNVGWGAYAADGATKLVVRDQSNALITVKDFVDAVNLAANAQVVSSFGLWDKNGQLIKGYTIAGGVWTPIGGAAANGAEKLTAGQGYQIFLKQMADPNNISIVIKDRP